MNRKHLDRRQFLRITGLGPMGVVLAGQGVWLTACGMDRDKMKKAVAAWRTLPSPQQDINPATFSLAYAILAPSSCNSQPWMVRLFDEGFDLHANPERMMPIADPLGRETLVSLGCFAEAATIAASSCRRQTTILPFPKGTENWQDGSRPVARLVFGKYGSAEDDPAFYDMARRRTNRLPYAEDTSFLSGELDDLKSALKGEGLSVRLWYSVGEREKLADLCERAVRELAQDADLWRDRMRWMRWSDDAFLKQLDGIGLAHYGLTGTKLHFARHMASPDDLHTEKFIDFMAQSARTQAMSARGFLLQSSPPDFEHTFRAGKAFFRFQLAAAHRVIASQPMNQVLLAPNIAKEFNLWSALPNWLQPQMMIRLGRANEGPATPRRDVSSILMG